MSEGMEQENVAEQPGLFGKIGNWFKLQKARYDVQKAIALREKGTIAYMKHQDSVFQEIEKMPGDSYDQYIRKAAFLSNQSSAYIEADRKGSIGNSRDIKMLSMAGNGAMAFNGAMNEEQDLLGKKTNIENRELFSTYANAQTNGGKGIGAWLGRLIHGRRSLESREIGQQAIERFTQETDYTNESGRDVVKVKLHEAEIRSGKLSVEQVLSKDFGKTIKMPNGESIADINGTEIRAITKTEFAKYKDSIAHLTAHETDAFVLSQDEAAKDVGQMLKKTPKRELDTDIDVVREKEQQIEKPEKEKVAMTPEELGDHKQEKKPEHKWVNAVMPTPESMTKKLNEQARAKGK